MDDARAPQAPWPDDEFVDFAQARQHALLRAAYLVCGRPRHRRGRCCARPWCSSPAVGPGRARSSRTCSCAASLYRDAVASWRHAPARASSLRGAGRLAHPTTVGRRGDRASTRGAAGAGCPDPAAAGRRRAAAGSRSASERRVRRRARVQRRHGARRGRQALGRLRDALPRADSGRRRAMSADLRELLELASDDVPELDLAPGPGRRPGGGTGPSCDARRSARGCGRRRCRWASSRCGTGRDPGPGPTPTPTATGVADGRLPTCRGRGSHACTWRRSRPTRRCCPRYPDAARLRHPAPPRPGRPGHPRRARARSRGVSGPLRAVFLVVGEAGGFHPVLFAPRAPFQVEVPRCGSPRRGRAVRPLGPRSISDDRHRVVIPQPGAVVVLDARDGSSARGRGARPDPVARGLGPGPGTIVVARGRDAGWLIDPRTGGAAQPQRAVNPDWADLAQGERSARAAHVLGGPGELTSSGPLLGPPVVPSTAIGVQHRGLGGGGARSSRRLPAGDRAVAGPGRGALDLPPKPRVLAATEGPLVPKGALPGAGVGARATWCSSSPVRREPVSRAWCGGCWRGTSTRACSTRSPTSTGPPATRAGEFSGIYTLWSPVATGRLRVLDPLAPRPDVRDGVDARRVQRQGELGRRDPRAARRAHRGVAVHPDGGGHAAAPRRAAGSGRPGRAGRSSGGSPSRARAPRPGRWARSRRGSARGPGRRAALPAAPSRRRAGVQHRHRARAHGDVARGRVRAPRW